MNAECFRYHISVRICELCNAGERYCNTCYRKIPHLRRPNPYAVNTLPSTTALDKADLFRVEDFPELAHELAEIKDRMNHIPCVNKAEMIISFARNHQIQASMVRLYPEVVKILIAKGVCLQLETVYTVYKGQNTFVQSLERYLAVHFNH
jgi:hypothetical protein